MPAYPKPPSSARIIATTVRRIKQLEAQLATRTVAGYAAGTYAANSVTNPTVETDIAGWVPATWVGGQGTLAASTVAPLVGGQSLRVTENPAGSTTVAWCPTGNTAAPTVGTDVFATSEGEQWLVSAVMRANTDPAGNSVVYAVYGTSPQDCYAQNYADQNWVGGAVSSLPAGQTQTMTGLTTCPSSRFYVTFAVTADDLGGTPGPWTWDMDSMTLQKKL
jgi:hypothetical protein